MVSIPTWNSEIFSVVPSCVAYQPAFTCCASLVAKQNKDSSDVVNSVDPKGGGGGTFLKVMDATGYVLLEYVLAVTAIGVFGIEILSATWHLNFLLVKKAIQ